MALIREHRGGPIDGRADHIQAAEAESKYYGYNDRNTKAMAIYRRAESAAIEDDIYHFYDFVKSIPHADGPRVLTELEYGDEASG